MGIRREDIIATKFNHIINLNLSVINETCHLQASIVAVAEAYLKVCCIKNFNQCINQILVSTKFLSKFEQYIKSGFDGKERFIVNQINKFAKHYKTPEGHPARHTCVPIKKDIIIWPSNEILLKEIQQLKQFITHIDAIHEENLLYELVKVKAKMAQKTGFSHNAHEEDYILEAQIIVLQLFRQLSFFQSKEKFTGGYISMAINDALKTSHEKFSSDSHKIQRSEPIEHQQEPIKNECAIEEEKYNYRKKMFSMNELEDNSGDAKLFNSPDYDKTTNDPYYSIDKVKLQPLFKKFLKETKLSPLQKKAFIWVIVDDLPQIELAVSEGKKTSSISRALKQAKAKFEQFLRQNL